jgi:hypothetical protein
VSPADRVTRSAALDGDAIRVSLGEAFSAAGMASADEVRLDTFDGRPVYRLRNRGRQTVVYADSRETRGSMSRWQADRIASSWVGRSMTTATIRAIDGVDQWIVQLPVARLTPLWQYSWPNGEQVYVSQESGEVVQGTRPGRHALAPTSALSLTGCMSRRCGNTDQCGAES